MDFLETICYYIGERGDFMATNIGRRIMERRQELGLTQEDLALRMGYKTKSAINKIELGINDVSQSKVVRFAEALHTTVAYLMDWEETKNEQTAFSDLPRSKQELMQFCQAVPDDKADLVLRVLKSILESD